MEKPSQPSPAPAEPQRPGRNTFAWNVSISCTLLLIVLLYLASIVGEGLQYVRLFRISSKLLEGDPPLSTVLQNYRFRALAPYERKILESIADLDGFIMRDASKEAGTWFKQSSLAYSDQLAGLVSTVGRFTKLGSEKRDLAKKNQELRAQLEQAYVELRGIRKDLAEILGIDTRAGTSLLPTAGEAKEFETYQNGILSGLPQLDELPEEAGGSEDFAIRVLRVNKKYTAKELQEALNEEGDLTRALALLGERTRKAASFLDNMNSQQIALDHQLTQAEVAYEETKAAANAQARMLFKQSLLPEMSKLKCALYNELRLRARWIGKELPTLPFRRTTPLSKLICKKSRYVRLFTGCSIQ